MDLRKLRRLLKVLRAEGVARYQAGEVTIELGLLPGEPAAREAPPVRPEVPRTPRSIDAYLRQRFGGKQPQKPEGKN